MISFLKSILKGLLYVLFFPFGLLAIAFYGVFWIFVFIYRIIKLAILFFTGRNLKNELDEDEEIRKILEANKPKEEDSDPVDPSMSLYPSDSDLYKVDYVSPTFEEKKEEANIEEVEEEEGHE